MYELKQPIPRGHYNKDIDTTWQHIVTFLTYVQALLRHLLGDTPRTVMLRIPRTNAWSPIWRETANCMWHNGCTDI